MHSLVSVSYFSMPNPGSLTHSAKKLISLANPDIIIDDMGCKMRTIDLIEWVGKSVHRNSANTSPNGSTGDDNDRMNAAGESGQAQTQASGIADPSTSTRAATADSNSSSGNDGNKCSEGSEDFFASLTDVHMNVNDTGMCADKLPSVKRTFVLPILDENPSMEFKRVLEFLSVSAGVGVVSRMTPMFLKASWYMIMQYLIQKIEACTTISTVVTSAAAPTTTVPTESCDMISVTATAADTEQAVAMADDLKDGASLSSSSNSMSKSMSMTTSAPGPPTEVSIDGSTDSGYSSVTDTNTTSSAATAANISILAASTVCASADDVTLEWVGSGVRASRNKALRSSEPAVTPTLHCEHGSCRKVFSLDVTPFLYCDEYHRRLGRPDIRATNHAKNGSGTMAKGRKKPIDSSNANHNGHGNVNTKNSSSSKTDIALAQVQVQAETQTHDVGQKVFVSSSQPQVKDKYASYRPPLNEFLAKLVFPERVAGNDNGLLSGDISSSSLSTSSSRGSKCSPQILDDVLSFDDKDDEEDQMPRSGEGVSWSLRGSRDGDRDADNSVFLLPVPPFTPQEVPKAHEGRVCLIKMFLFCLRQFIPLKYVTINEFLIAYPEFIDRQPLELGLLKLNANWFELVLFASKPQNNKSFLITSIPPITEGFKIEYITGSGESQRTKDRVSILRSEGGIPIVRRAARNRKSRREQEQDLFGVEFNEYYDSWEARSSEVSELGNHRPVTLFSSVSSRRREVKPSTESEFHKQNASLPLSVKSEVTRSAKRRKHMTNADVDMDMVPSGQQKQISVVSNSELMRDCVSSLCKLTPILSSELMHDLNSSQCHLTPMLRKNGSLTENMYVVEQRKIVDPKLFFPMNTMPADADLKAPSCPSLNKALQQNKCFKEYDRVLPVDSTENPKTSKRIGVERDVSAFGLEKINYRTKFCGPHDSSDGGLPTKLNSADSKCSWEDSPVLLDIQLPPTSASPLLAFDEMLKDSPKLHMFAEVAARMTKKIN